jgi:hypothetical protein
MSREVSERRLATWEDLNDLPEGVLPLLYAIEKVVGASPVGRQALAGALWRACARMNQSEELWTEKLVLTDGGRQLAIELRALWKKE